MPDFAAHRKKLRQLIRRSQAEGLLVTNFTNVTYLTGFSGDDSYLLVTPDAELLISDMRYTTQLDEECPGLKLVIREPGEEMLPTVSKTVKKARIEQLGVEAGAMTLGTRDKLAEQLSGQTILALDGLVETLRVIKDKHEVQATRVACMQARRAFEVVRAGLTDDMTELDVAAELEYQARRFGAKKLSFDAIVAVGPRGDFAARPADAQEDRRGRFHPVRLGR